MEVNIPLELLIQTILTAVIGWVVKTILEGILEQLKSYREESTEWRHAMDKKVDDINDATQANMRTNILHYCEKYITRGWVTSEELSSLNNLHEKYTMLNNHNGFINGYVDRVNLLEIREI